VFDAGAAEIVAHDPKTQRLFVVNAQDATVDVLDIKNPSNPTKLGSLDVTTHGAVANSVAVQDGIIAVAVEAAVKTDPGVVVFFDGNLTFRAKVVVGALPDMVTFTPNGRYVLVANEGEPNADYSVDPEGTVSVIDLSGGISKLKQSSVRNARFTQFNTGQLDSSIRIFGPNANVAQCFS
jgi:DNA-binding beta-propeller fold protein YncE